jgi:hypothetical protein
MSSAHKSIKCVVERGNLTVSGIRGCTEIMMKYTFSISVYWAINIVLACLDWSESSLTCTSSSVTSRLARCIEKLQQVWFYYVLISQPRRCLTWASKFLWVRQPGLYVLNDLTFVVGVCKRFHSVALVLESCYDGFSPCLWRRYTWHWRQSLDVSVCKDAAVTHSHPVKLRCK